MGAASSSGNQLPSPGRKLSGLGETRVPSSSSGVPKSLWNSEPRVILANNSDYVVSYWVIEEDKKRTKAQQERIVRSMALHLNASKITGRNLSEDLKKLKEEETLARKTGEGGEGGDDDDVVYYLTRDHRMGRKGSTQPSHVPFPAGCRHVRLYGFYERDGEWVCYKDKVYSIALRNKNFRVTAQTANIAPCVALGGNCPKKKTRPATKRRGQIVTA